MAVVYTPSSWITGIVVSDATYLQIPWSSLSTAAQNETDIRNILRSIAVAIKTHYDTPTPDDAPTKFTPTTGMTYVEAATEFEEKTGWTFRLTPGTTTLASE